MDAVERIRAEARKRADEAVEECLAGIRRYRDERAASAASHRAEAEWQERQAAILEAEKQRIFPQS